MKIAIYIKRGCIVLTHPLESVVLVAKLLKFLEKQGLYIKVWWGL
jgi:hypothetical protein